MSDQEIWETAQSLLRIHGALAPMEAAMMADKLFARRDMEGHETWKRITLAVRKLENGHAQ